MDITLLTPEELCRELGSRVRTARLAQGMPRTELAARAAVALGSIVNLESAGACTLATLIRVAQALGLDDDLQLVFVRRAQSIAEMEQAEGTIRRQRARRPTPARPGK